MSTDEEARLLSPEKNERLTRVGPRTPMGDVLRRYWVPAALEEEVPSSGGSPVRVRLLGEELLLVRDVAGVVALVRRPRHGVDGLRARLAEGELARRCAHHGATIGPGGCADPSAEAPQATRHDGSDVVGYPTWCAAGIVWAYLGPCELVPAVPDYDWVRAPRTHVRISRSNEHCNWVQALEGGLDTAHVAFTHNNDIRDQSDLWQRDTHPRLHVETTDYGFRYAGLRDVGKGRDWIRAYQFIMPFQQMRPGTMKADGTRRDVPVIDGHLWVPMDDVSVAVYNFAYSVEASIAVTDDFWAREEARFGRSPEDYIDGTFWLRRHPGNDYLIDREVQRTRTFTGIEGLNTQDFALQEGMGPICDRSREHLGTSDRAIIRLRQLLLEAADVVAEGKGTLRALDPSTYRSVRAGTTIAPSDVPWADAVKDEMVAAWR